MKGTKQKEVPTGIKYFAVIYLFNDTIHAIPFNSQEAAEKYGSEFVEKANKDNAKKHDPKKAPYVKNFYVSKRNMDKYPNGEVF